METFGFDDDGFLARNGYGPPLLHAPVEGRVVTLHRSEASGYEWVVWESGRFSSASGLDRVWKGLQIGANELIIGLAPEGTAEVNARLDDADGSVPVHLGTDAYWLVVPLARDVTLTFSDAQGGVLWEYRISGWRMSWPLPDDPFPDAFKLQEIARYRLSEPLATIRVGDEEVTIHRQEEAHPLPGGRRPTADTPSPVGRLWGLLRDGNGGPLQSDDDPRRPKDSDPGTVHVGEDWRVFAGTRPPGAARGEARVGDSGEVRVEFAPEVFSAVLPSRERAVVTLRNVDGVEVARYELPPWQPPRDPRILDLLGDAIFYLDFPTRLRARIEGRYILPWVKQGPVGYSYGPFGWRRELPDLNEGVTLRGAPPALPRRELPGGGASWSDLVVPGAVLLALAGALRWLVRHLRRDRT